MGSWRKNVTEITLGSYQASFSGVVDTFFIFRKLEITIFFLSAPNCLLPGQLGCWPMLLLSGAISPCTTHARRGSWGHVGIEGKS